MNEGTPYGILTRLARLGAAAVPPAQLAERALLLALEAVGAEGGDLCVVAGYVRHALHSWWPELPSDAGRAPSSEPDPTLEKLFSAGVAVDCTHAAAESLRAIAHQLGYHSCATVPILCAGRPVGVLDCAARRPNAFDAEALELLTTIGAMLGPLLDQALQVTGATATELAQNVLELRALQRVSEAVARSLDLDEVLGRCLDVALQVAHTGAGAIYLRDARRGIYRRVVARSVPDEVAPVELPTADIDRRFATGPAELVDVGGGTVTHPTMQAARQQGFLRVIALPLRVEGRLVGLLGLHFLEPMTILPSTVLTLEAIAGQEAMAIENARVHRLVELRARLALTLREFGERAIAPITVPEIYNLILETALALTRSDRGLISRISHTEKNAQVMVGVGTDASLVGLTMSLDEPYMAQTFASTKPFVVEDTSVLLPDSMIGRVAREKETASFVLLTLRYRGQPIGQLFAGSGEARRYEEEEIEAIQILSSMAAEVLERARVQGESDAERRRLDATIEHLPIVIAVINRRGETLHLNAAGRQFATDFNPEYRGDWRKSIQSIRTFTPDGKPIPTDQMAAMQAFRGAHPPPQELLLVSPDDKRRMIVWGVAAPLYTNEKGEVEAVVTAFQDVSPLRELADAKDRFLRVASHELRSPITSLRATTSLLELDPTAITDETRRTTMLLRIKRQVDRLIKLVEQLLDSARLSSAEVPIQPIECDLVELANDAVELAASDPNDRMRVRIEGDASVRGEFDPVRIEQVLTNLIGNALRYSAAPAEVRINLRADSSTATIEIINLGIGIPEEQLKQVFTPFFRAANATQVHRAGLGLGLHITAEIVRRHNGRIRVASRLGHGSTFTVELPRTRPAPTL